MSYVTVTEADLYVRTHYLPNEVEYTAWVALSPEQQQVILVRAFDRIERLPFTGRKHSAQQPAAFPRNMDTEVPEVVKSAQVVEAVHDPAINSTDSSNRSMRVRGVKSYSIGHLSETFVDSAGGTYGSAMNSVSAEVLTMLAPYMSGGYAVR